MGSTSLGEPGAQGMVALEVEEVKGDELHLWDALVAGSAEGTVFHTSDWLVRNASLQDRTLILLGCYADGELIGGCPLFLSNPYKILKIASSTTIATPYGGMVLSEIENAKQRKRELHNRMIIVSILEHIAGEGFDHVNLVHSPGLQDIRAFTQNGWDPRVYYTYILSLHDDLLKNTSKDVRQNIRKAQKHGISTTKQFDPEIFWSLTMSTFTKQGKKPPFSREHLLGLLDLITSKNLGEMRVAHTSSGEIVAAEVTLWDPKMAHSWSAASSEEHLSMGAASLLCYDTFTGLSNLGVRRINLMGGNMTQLSSFVSGFNPDLVPYFGVEYSRPKYAILKRFKRE
ncbi:hypothetical protein ABH15_06425 [Methanoculleus taiwanensis]|uniref:BioF2-like acetyltransferase domain-containing protein n=2 Tax=Methanoculleus taiwanensis TaxID=1550565 RepID=A0A498GZ92_9EURY|nr:hypothetical protein ABH15_06425 [Methanoculleus taiwanensis]